jgi:hypothetical protein
MAFDKDLTILPGPPSFNLVWSSRPTASGHYVAAFVYGNLRGPPVGLTAQQLLGLLANVNITFNLGFLVLGQQPTTATPQAQAFANSVTA